MIDYECWELPIGLLEFIPSTHTYIFNGVIVPSITQLLKIKFGDKYLGVLQSILDRASELGTEMHKTIQNYEELNIDDINSLELQNYKFLKRHYKWVVEACEIPIVLIIDEKIIGAGRLDLLVKKDGKLGILDLKRTYSFDKEYVYYQTNLYRLGVKSTYNKNIEFVGGIHLRENKRKYYDLPINDNVLNFIKERKNNNE